MPSPTTVLVAGAAGYIGSAFVRLLLARGRRARALNNLCSGGEPLLEVVNHPAFAFIHGNISAGVATSRGASTKARGQMVVVGEPGLSPEGFCCRASAAQPCVRGVASKNGMRVADLDGRTTGR